MRRLEVVLARDFQLNRSRRVMAIYRTSSLDVKWAGELISRNWKRSGFGGHVRIRFCCFVGGRRRGARGPVARWKSTWEKVYRKRTDERAKGVGCERSPLFLRGRWPRSASLPRWLLLGHGVCESKLGRLAGLAFFYKCFLQKQSNT